MNEKFPMTAEGLRMLRNELENLKNFERPNIIKAIAEAREHGDLSENAEYHAAREKQSFIEGRIVELEHIEKNLISVSAPLCKAMINKKVDDVFEVQTPNGIKEFQINSIDFI